MGPFLDFTLGYVFTSSPYGFCLKFTMLIVVVSIFNPHAAGVLVLKWQQVYSYSDAINSQHSTVVLIIKIIPHTFQYSCFDNKIFPKLFHLDSMPNTHTKLCMSCMCNTKNTVTVIILNTCIYSSSKVMASSEPTNITSASLQRSPNANTTETTPLVKVSKVRRSSLMKKLRESVVIKSKAANMILIWSAFAYLIYGTLLNPENVFVVPVRQLQLFHDSRSIFFKLTDNTSTFMNMIGSGVYGLVGMWLLFYPLAGYLADVRFGRYKVVTFGLKMIWSGLLTFVVMFTILYFVGSALMGYTWLTTFYFGLDPDNSVVIGFGVSSTGLLLITYLILCVGFVPFAANIVQLGIDQLQDLPARSSFLFIYWLILTLYAGVSLGKIVWSTMTLPIIVSRYPTILIPIGYVLLAAIVALYIFGLPLPFYCSKPDWFTANTGIGNPYREVIQVVSFARQHKIPIRRSAFTYWEDDIPTGLDLGKSKYGGPFTTDQVENVKAFFGIVYILFTIGPIFTADIAASALLPMLGHHMDSLPTNYTIFFDPTAHDLPRFMVGYSGTLNSLFIVTIIPIFLKIIHPLFERYIPGILKRIGIGLCLITVSLLCSLFVDTIGHALPNGQNATSIFNPGHIEETKIEGENYTKKINSFVDASSLQLSPYILIIQNFLVAVAYILIYGGVFEFISAQSPHSMKGVLIGIFYAVKGLFQLIGVLGILLPFSFWQTSPRAGLVYFLVNIVISVVSVVAFTVAAKRYQYRQRDDFCNIRKYIEEFYEKEIEHNREFKHITINAPNDSDP